MNAADLPDEALFEGALNCRTPAERAAYLDQVCAGQPELRRQLEVLLAAHDRSGNFLEQAAAARDPGLKLDLPREEAPATVIGRYKLLEKIGEGGAGVVYMAEQTEPIRRRVALKVIKLGMDTKQVVARFEVERQALALMDHPNIAKVLDAGATETGRPFFVMELVRGTKITDYCDQNNLSTRQRLDLFVQVCHAVQHAHQKGIIHRDLKPSNILVTLHDGVPVPKVIDFGIAKATEQPLTDKTLFTAYQQLIGTPAYMSPEQAELSGLDIDTRSDIYSLGVLLYELLTGKTPFEQKELLQAGLDEMRRWIREKEPPRPSTRLSTLTKAELTDVARHHGAETPKLIPLVRGDLDWIVMKCLEKDRTRRYETANGLAADLERHLNDEPVMAGPPTAGYRVKKFVRKHRRGVAVAAGFVVLLVAAVVVSAGLAVWANRERDRADRLAKERERQRQRAEEKAEQLRRTLYAADLKLAQEALSKDRLGSARSILERYQRPPEQDLRGWEWRYLWQSCRSDALGDLHRYSNAVVSTSWSPDGRLLAVAGYWGFFVDLWDMQVPGGRRIVTLQTNEGYLVAFSPRGDLLASDAWPNPDVIRIWQSGTTSILGELPHPAGVKVLKFSPDGARLASLNNLGKITIWEVGQWTQPCMVLALSAPSVGTFFGDLDFSPDGKALVAGGNDGQLHVVDLGTDEARPRLRFPAHAEGITTLAWSPSAPIIASGSGYNSGVIRLWDAASGKPIGHLEGHSSWVSRLVFSADGQKLYSASADQTIRIWDVPQRRCLTILRGSTDMVFDLALSPDGTRLASGSADGALTLWSTQPRSNEEQPRLIALGFGSRRDRFMRLKPAFAANGQVLAVPLEGIVSLYDLPSFHQIESIPLLGTNNSVVAYSPGDAYLVSGGADGRVRVYSSFERRLLTELLGHQEEIMLFAFPTNGGKMLSVDFAGKAIWWDLSTWRSNCSYSLPDVWSSASLSPDGRVLVAGHRAGLVRWWDAATGRLLASRQAHRGLVQGVAFSPDGNLLASAGDDGTLALWDALSREMTADFKLAGFGVGVAFSPDGQRLVTGAAGGEAIKLWDLSTRRELLVLSGQGSGFFFVGFSPDNNWLAVCNHMGQLHVWHADPFPHLRRAR